MPVSGQYLPVFHCRKRVKLSAWDNIKSVLKLLLNILVCILIVCSLHKFEIICVLFVTLLNTKKKNEITCTIQTQQNACGKNQISQIPGKIKSKYLLHAPMFFQYTNDCYPRSTLDVITQPIQSVRFLAFCLFSCDSHHVCVRCRRRASSSSSTSCTATNKSSIFLIFTSFPKPIRLYATK